jgi:ATP-dependent helicase IRC3
MLVVDHREELTNQALDKLKKWNPGRTVGVEMGNRRSDGEQIVVSGVATTGRKGSPSLTQFNPADFDIIVVDEAHHATAQSYRTIFDHFMVMTDTHRLLLGVTATPNRATAPGWARSSRRSLTTRTSSSESCTAGWPTFAVSASRPA